LPAFCMQLFFHKIFLFKKKKKLEEMFIFPYLASVCGINEFEICS